MIEGLFSGLGSGVSFYFDIEVQRFKLGDVQGGVLTSGMHTLEKLKEYESGLLL